MWHLIYPTVDTIETYFDSHVDLLQRKLQKHSDKLKMAAEEAFKELKIKDLSGDLLTENLEREIRAFKVKVGVGTIFTYLLHLLMLQISFQHE